MRNEKGQFVKGFKHSLGQKRSEETKRKISEIQKGKKLSEATKLKISVALKGRKYKPMSEKGRLNISLSHKSKRGPRSIETRIKLSEARKGDKWCTWKGGVSTANEIIRKSLSYKIWRTAVFVRDGYACVLCGAKGCVLNADHIKRFSDFPEHRFNVNNGRTLCIDCHRNTSTYGNRKQAVH